MHQKIPVPRFFIKPFCIQPYEVIANGISAIGKNCETGPDGKWIQNLKANDWKNGQHV